MGKNHNQPIIGIVPSFDDGTVIPGRKIDRLFLRREYTFALANVGVTPIILSPDMSLMSIVSLRAGGTI